MTGILSDALLYKHLPADPSIVLSDTPSPVNPIIFEDLTHELVWKPALRTQGVAGLSGLEAAAWRHMCSSFGTFLNPCVHWLLWVGLCVLWMYTVHPIAVSAFVAGRLIPLDKCPGVRPRVSFKKNH